MIAGSGRRLAVVLLAAAALAGVIAAPADAQRAGGTGAYRAVMRADPGLPTHTLYRPRLLRRFGGDRLLPIVAWGNGGCVDIGDASRNFLTEIASHGMLAIAVGPIRGNRPQRPDPLPAPGEPVPRPPTDAAQLIDAIDWALAENARPDSDYFGKLDVDAIALMGYSCGGLQALSRALDPRVKTLGMWNSGVAADGVGRPGLAVGKDMLARLRVPVIYIVGGPTDIAYRNAIDDVGRITGTAVFFGSLDVGHGGTFAEPNGGAYGRVAADWLRWQLLGDRDAARTFAGADCTLCTDPAWTVAKRNID